MNKDIISKIKKYKKIIYIIIIIICVIIASIIIKNKFFNNTSKMQTNQNKETEENKQLEENFDNIFLNKLENSYDLNKVKLIDNNKNIVYTNLEIEKSSTNNYDVKLNIPYINIDNDTIKSYNNEIQEFVQKYEEILKTKNQNVIYDVEYNAYIKNDILSVIIKANLKEGESAQSLIIQTYNYDLKQNKEVKLIDVLKLRNINKENMKNKINEKITNAKKNADDLNSLGYVLYKRDVNNKMYLVENINQFYISSNCIYVIFAYGNDARTSEMDIVTIN